jgi:hypothetical protein
MARKPIPDPALGYRICTHCEKTIPLTDLVSRVTQNGTRYARRCKPCNRAINRAAYWEAPEFMRNRVAVWRINNLEKRRAYQQEYAIKTRENINAYVRQNVANLTDSYVRATLVKVYNGKRTLSASEIPDELVALKRVQMQIKRQLKENAT